MVEEMWYRWETKLQTGTINPDLQLCEKPVTPTHLDYFTIHSEEVFCLQNNGTFNLQGETIMTKSITNKGPLFLIVVLMWIAAFILIFPSFAVSADNSTIQQKPQTLEDLDPSMFLMQSVSQEEAQEVHESIYKATGFGNTFMVVTKKGNVIIDTSMPNVAPKHKELLSAVSDGPIHTIIITHAHGDHTGGIDLWRQENTRVIMQQNAVEFLHYQKRLEGFFNLRNAAQFGFDLTSTTTNPDKTGNYDAEIPATLLFEETHEFRLGDLTFKLLHTPGETYDALCAWIPEIKAVFVGDLFYGSFPNIYTLRGTKPRYALDYVESIDKILALRPEIMLPSHGEPVLGNDIITSALEKYRDAILYVHDKTVAGMNQGKDVYTLMEEISLPEELDLEEGYGKISWSVRGIYEGYAGWFDGHPANMYTAPEGIIFPEMIKLAGGPDVVAGEAERLMKEGDVLKALRMSEAVLEVDADNKQALDTVLKAYGHLRERAANYNEAGWLNHGKKQAEKRLWSAK